MITIKKGLDLPIAGKPAQVIHSGKAAYLHRRTHTHILFTKNRNLIHSFVAGLFVSFCGIFFDNKNRFRLIVSIWEVENFLTFFSGWDNANVVSLAQPGEAINELKSGQVEGVVLEKAIAQGYIEQNNDLAVSDIALKSDSKDAYAVAMPKGSDKLKAKVNKVIAKLKKEGKIDSYVQDAYALSLKSSTK